MKHIQKNWRKTDLSEVLPIEIEITTPLNCAGPITSEQNECLEPESVRVDTIAVLSVAR